MDLRLLGSMAALQEDPTVFQIGTAGRYGDEAFELVGRVQRRWSGGVWNEWHMCFGGGRSGWLAEAQGLLMVSFRVPEPPPSERSMQLGQRFEFRSHSYMVHDIKEVLASYAEGELPVVTEQGSTVRSIDLTGPGSLFACASFSDGGAELYLGEYRDFDSFHFQRVREFDGW
jgi:hypothetical protein